MERLLLIEDDDTTREVLGLLLRADGWEVADAPHGEAALALVNAARPDVVLCDLQLPGICGTALSSALRKTLPENVTLLAMTATQLADVPDGYDGLLVKPFHAHSVRDAIHGVKQFSTGHTGTQEPVMALTVFDAMKSALPVTQLRAMYDVALDDAEARVRAMEAAKDDAAFRSEAHALKGSCAMIGARRVQSFAAFAEENGLQESSMQRMQFVDFRLEISAVRRMLERLLAGGV